MKTILSSWRDHYLAKFIILLITVALIAGMVGCGGKINKDLYTDYQGKRVYFCCAACIEPFNKDPEKYIKKLQDEGVVLEKAPDSG